MQVAGRERESRKGRGNVLVFRSAARGVKGESKPPRNPKREERLRVVGVSVGGRKAKTEKETRHF